MKKTRQRSDRNELKRENQRLRKQLNRLSESIESMTGGEDDVPPEPEEEDTKPAPDCPQCGKPAEEVSLGRFTYLFCTECSYRSRKNSASR